MYCPSNYSTFPWMQYALQEYGTREVSGPGDNPRIVEYLASVGLGHHGDETAWCSAFCNWCFEQAGLVGTDSAAARSWLNWQHGGMCLERPYWGCVTVLWRESPSSWKGHVGFCVGTGKNTVLLLGGNQGNAVSLADYASRRVLRHIWPAGYPLSQPV